MRTSTEAVARTVTEPMQALYTPPYRCENPELAIEQYIEHLRGYTVEQLEAGWQLVVDEHDERSWPTVAAIKKACNKATRRFPANTQQSESPVKGPERTEEIMRSPLGRRAIENGFAADLERYVERTGYVPDHGWVKRQEAAAEQIKRLSPSDLGRASRNLYAGIVNAETEARERWT